MLVTSDRESEELYSSSVDGASVTSCQSRILQEILTGLSMETWTAEEMPPVPGPNFDVLFTLSDTSEYIVFDSVGRVVTATPSKLVERLTGSVVDSQFMDDFLLVFRNFMSATELSKMLAFRLEQGFLTTPTSNEWQCVKLRTFVVLRQWMRNYYEVDFVMDEVKKSILESIRKIRMDSKSLTLSDQQILMKLRKMALQEYHHGVEEASVTVTESQYSLPRDSVSDDGTSSDSLKKKSWIVRIGNRLKNGFKSKAKSLNNDGGSLRAHSIEISTSSVDVSSPWTGEEDLAVRYEKHSCLALESTTMLAEHLCLMEGDLLRQLPWTDLLCYPLKQPETVQRSITHFNQICQWIIEEILRTHSYQEQTTVIFASLHPAWRRVSAYEHALCEELVSFASPLRNFRNVRKAMELQEPHTTPCIPFTGLYLADLASNSERPDPKEGEGHLRLLSWTKHQRAARTIRQFRAFQQIDRSYSYMLKPELSQYLQNSLEQIQQDKPDD